MFEWKAEYVTGVVELDNQHKELFNTGQRVNALLKEDKSVDIYDDLIGLLQGLKTYTEDHFGYEENYLTGCNQLTPEHVEEHAAFMEKLEDVLAKDIDMSQRAIIFELAVFLSNWLVSHILETDMKYKKA